MVRISLTVRSIVVRSQRSFLSTSIHFKAHYQSIASTTATFYPPTAEMAIEAQVILMLEQVAQEELSIHQPLKWRSKSWLIQTLIQTGLLAGDWQSSSNCLGDRLNPLSEILF